MDNKITNISLMFAKNYIDEHTHYTVESQIYDRWVIKINSNFYIFLLVLYIK